MHRTGSHIELASPGRRMAAGLVNVAQILFLGALAIAIGANLPLVRRWRDSDSSRPMPAKPSRAMRLVTGASTAADVAYRNQRSLGARLLGIRRVDATTGGPISVRSAVVHRLVTDLAWRVMQIPSRRSQLQLREIAPILREIQQRHAGNPEASAREIAEVYRTHDVNPFGSCWLTFVGPLLMQLPAFFSRNRQTLPDRLAGIVVVRER